MSGFDRLSPALQYQIVNGLGWTELRPVQIRTIDAVLDGQNVVVLAPTAGGKTEASLFPLLSLMDAEDWSPCSVLYVAPIRALLNNQDARLARLTGLIGRRAFKWHGDVSSSARKGFLREPADILATTPESLEAMLISSRTPPETILGRVRAVIIDEVHAFAADARGSHLVAVLERIQRLSGHDIQRIGLSATVGDPEEIAAWLSGSSSRPSCVVDPGGASAKPELLLDYVGSLDNAATVIDRLYPGTRRLVFVDSRKGVEELGDHLRRRDVNVYVTHSSLSVGERTLAERAFEQESNCVIVATSALELGIDVGDLDHVIQIDAPSTVASFLQRMGRTGRRPGTRANCTFLTTDGEATLHAAALLRLHARGYVEPSQPDRRAGPVLAQQVLALALQQRGIPRRWWNALEGCAAFDQIQPGEREALIRHMTERDILAELEGTWILGDHGRKLFGARNFLDLMAVFSTPRVLTVMYGPREIGTIDAFFLRQTHEGPLGFVLGGERWKVTDILWRKGLCMVERSEDARFPRWYGEPRQLTRELCRAMRDVLRDDSDDAVWSQRATAVIHERRAASPWVHEPEPSLIALDGRRTRLRLYTYDGGEANAVLAARLEARLGGSISADNIALTFSGGAAQAEQAILIALRELEEAGPPEGEEAQRIARQLGSNKRQGKFEESLPDCLRWG